MADILVADDTRAMRNALSILLEEEGHSVRLAADGAEALAEYRRKRPDMLLLDVMMPKKNGYQVLRQIRDGDPELPVIFLSAKGSSADVALGLDLGSDDYLPKPFDKTVLVSRINAIFRRVKVQSAQTQEQKECNGFSIASCRVDCGRLTLVAPDGGEEALSLREIGILRMLVENADKVVSKDRLVNELWGVSYSGTSRTLDQHVFRLRKKLGADGGCIETVRNAGYRYLTRLAAVCLCLVFAAANACASDVNVGPFFERDQESGFTAVRPFWSETPATTDCVWPLGTWHSNEGQFWYRFLFLAYGHEKSFNFFPLWFSETDRTIGDFHWALFPVCGSHPHMLFMDDIHFAMWPAYMDYSVKGVRSRAVLWPIFSWKEEPREAVGVWPLFGWSRLRESTHRYALWPVLTWADHREDRDTSGKGKCGMLWPLFGAVERERERQVLILPPLFSWAETPETRRLRCPWPLVDIELGPKRDRWSVWPIVERSVQKRYSDGAAEDVIWRFGWQLAEKTNSRFSFFPFLTVENDFLRVWPFWSRRVSDGRETVKVLDLIPVRNADGFARNWEPFWSLYSSEDLSAGRVRRKFLFNFFWWTSAGDVAGSVLPDGKGSERMRKPPR